MPQISQLPPPYSRDYTSFPPPLRGDVDHRAWAFQLVFENARELVRWTVLNTFKVWQGDWALKGREVVRSNVQHAYSQAPEDLKLAVDWQIKWDTPLIMRTDDVRRWHEHVRQKEAGTYEEVLTPEKFEREFDTASQAVQRAVLSTFATWKWFHEHVVMDRPSRKDLLPMYQVSPRPQKVVLCFMLEMAVDVPMRRPQDVIEWEATFLKTVEVQRGEARRWDSSGRGAGLW